MTKNENKGLIGSVVIHALLVLLMFLMVYAVEKEDPLDGGVEVMLGEPDAGGFDEVPVSAEEVIEESSPEETVEEETVVSQDQEDAPEVKATEEKKSNPNPTPDPKKDPTDKPVEKRKADARSLFKKKTDSEGKGTGDKPGNEGREDGSPDGEPKGQGGNGIGFSGDGFSGKIDGFKAIYTPSIEYNQQEVGTVKVRVCVDVNGKIIPMMTQWKGGTASSSYLKELSIRKANEFKFKRIGDATETNCGIITFTYKAR